MEHDEMMQLAARALVPILEQESGMAWGEQSAARILRWTLENSGLRLEWSADDTEENPYLLDSTELARLETMRRAQ